MHVDVDYHRSASRGAPSDEPVVCQDHQTRDDPHPSDETEHERHTRLVMLLYGDDQEFNREYVGDEKTPAASDVERLQLDRDHESVPLELRASSDGQDDALDSASDATTPVRSETPCDVPQTSVRAAKLVTAREMWYMLGTFIVTVFLALTLTSMGGLLPGVQPAAVSGGFSYNKWEHFRQRAGWSGGSPPKPPSQSFRDPHLRKGEDFWQTRLRKRHGIDITVETAAALSLTVYGMISAAQKAKQRSPMRRAPPPADEIPPAAPYAPDPHSDDPFSRHLHRQHRPDS